LARANGPRPDAALRSTPWYILGCVGSSRAKVMNIPEVVHDNFAASVVLLLVGSLITFIVTKLLAKTAVSGTQHKLTGSP
jgi:hypothetical protein